MSRNINIQLDSTLIDNLTNIAKSKGRSLSEEIEYRLLMVPLEVIVPKKTTVSSKLRGIIKLDNDFDYKQEMSDRIL